LNKSKPKRLVGWQYVAIAKQFKSTLNNGRKKSRILINCGSSDPSGYTEMILGVCLTCLNNVTIDVVLGPNYFENNSNCVLTKYNSRRIEFHVNVDNLEDYFTKADFAILTYGQTAFEAFSTGTPTVLIPISTDHYLSSQSISKKGFGLSVNYPVELIDIEKTVVKMNRIFKKVYSRIVNSTEFDEIRNASISNAINICFEEKGGY
jgi:spore coat polysaccharide biosynthesis predicted glycosyltransferase SpsG